MFVPQTSVVVFRSVTTPRSHDTSRTNIYSAMSKKSLLIYCKALRSKTAIIRRKGRLVSNKFNLFLQHKAAVFKGILDSK